MNEQQLRRELFQHKGFLGVFSSDTIPDDIKKGQALIVNTAPKGTEGQHWLALYKDPEDGLIEIFDSYGLSSLDTYPFVKNWLTNNNNEKIRRNIGQIQSDESDSCGIFCTLFIILRLKNYASMKQFINIFDNSNGDGNLELNDCIALYFLSNTNNIKNLKNYKNVESLKQNCF
jgi:hypothetical protein